MGANDKAMARARAALTAAAQVQPERCPTCGCETAHPSAVHLVDCNPQPAPEADEREWTQGAPWHFVHAPQAEEREALRAEVALHRQVGDMCTCGERTVRWFGWRDHFVEVLMARRSQPAPRTVSAETPTCRTFDDHGGSICDRPAQFVVWGHLYEKRYKGPKCARHVPPGVFLPGGFGTPAIYEIPALGITVEAPRDEPR